MKQILPLLLFISLTAASQKPMYCTVNFNPIGNGFSAVAVAGKTNDSFHLSSRALPGIPFLLLQADSVTVAGDSVKGKMRVLNYTMLFSGIATADSLSLNLTSSKDGAYLGLVTGSRQAGAPKNYANIAQQIIDSTERLIFNKTYIENAAWDKFKNTLRTTAPYLQDDLELLALFYKEARLLPFTHFELTKKSDAEFKDMLQEPKDNEHTAVLTTIAGQTALLKVANFNGDGSRLDSLMKQVIINKYNNLIIDLRGNTGGGAGAAMELVKYLSATTRPAGAIVTRQWFNNHTAPPTAEQYTSLTSFSKGSTRMLIAAIPHILGFYLQIQPAALQYTGKLYLLTDSHTASTCEPFVYGLQYYKRATVVGTKTAGAVLSKIPVPLGNDYVLFAPMADYFTIDGKRLDKTGVQPDVETAADKALDKALELITAKN